MRIDLPVLTGAAFRITWDHRFFQAIIKLLHIIPITKSEKEEANITVAACKSLSHKRNKLLRMYGVIVYRQ